MTTKIPESHQDLFLEPVHGVLTTLMPDGQPQMSVVWLDYDGENVLVSTILERQKGKNMQANPKVSVIVIDPKNGDRFVQVRGDVVEFIEENAIPFCDKLTQAYTQNRLQHYYGDIVPVDQLGQETRVIVKIAPKRVTTDAIFS